MIKVYRENPEYDLLIAGDGAYRETLEKQAKGLPNIEFLGRLSQEGLAEMYRNALAVIVPSICYETFGIIIIEAFSYKTPVLVNDLGALPEVVEDSGGGFVYRTEGELLESMRTIAENPELRDELGEKGNRAYLKYWNEDPHLDEYLELIRSLQAEKAKKAEAKR